MKGKRGEVRGRLQRLREGGLGGDGGGERASVRVGYGKPAKFENACLSLCFCPCLHEDANAKQPQDASMWAELIRM